MRDDAELLRQYVQAGSEDAFAELVQRHLPIVYSSALRQTDGDVELAKDICQTVFIDFGRKAGSLLGHELLIGWLFSATRFAAATVLRANRRRQIRERIAVSMHEDAATPASECRDPKLASALDAAMEELTSEDRNAVLLRFFQGKDFKDVGTALGISEDAARMRVTRAIGKLHSLLESRGVTVSAAALGSILATEAVTAVPAGLAAAISAAALAGIPLATTATATVAKAMAMTILNKTLITATVAVLAGVGIYEARQAANARADVRTLQQRRVPLTGQIQQLQHERDEAKNQLAALTDEIARLKGNTGELLKLRALVTRLRGENSQINDPSVQAALLWETKKEKLQKLFEERPDQRIPDMRLLTDVDWLTLAKDLDLNSLDSEAGRSLAMHQVRFNAKLRSASIISEALRKFIEANNGGWPSDVSQLKSFLDQPIEDEILQRYRILDKSEAQSGWLNGMVLTEKVAGNVWQETQIAIGPTNYGGGPVAAPVALTFPQVLVPAMKAYQAQHPQQVPTDMNELRPYLTTPEQEAALDKLVKAWQGQ